MKIDKEGGYCFLVELVQVKHACEEPIDARPEKQRHSKVGIATSFHC